MDLVLYINNHMMTMHQLRHSLYNNGTEQKSNSLQQLLIFIGFYLNEKYL